MILFSQCPDQFNFTGIFTIQKKTKGKNADFQANQEALFPAAYFLKNPSSLLTLQPSLCTPDTSTFSTFYLHIPVPCVY